MGRFRKKPVVIEAVRFDGSNFDEVYTGLGITNQASQLPGGRGPRGIVLPAIDIKTTEGTMRADPGDWVIRGIAGEYYPCKPDIFEKSYEPVYGDS